jgi:phosphoribosylformylglycinamidine synthase
MKARVFVSLKPSVLDPQGDAIAKALHSLGHGEIESVRVGKYFDVEFAAAASREDLEAKLQGIAQDVLSNPVIEDFQVDICAES